MPPRYAIEAKALNDKDLTDDARESNSATYCPEDNKLRLYLAARVERDSYDYLRKVGYVATPKQDCSFVATWSTAAEDAALALIADEDDIGDEDTSPADRAADRAERFAGYRDKRRTEAHGHADRYDAGPAVVGFQNQARAERVAARHDRTRDRAGTQWSKAEYWQSRTSGVIGHALHKGDARTRRGRILTLEAEQRKHAASLQECRENWEAARQLLEIEGGEVQIIMQETYTHEKEPGTNTTTIKTHREYNIPPTPAWKAAYRFANQSSHGWDYKHPRNPEARLSSLYSLLTDSTDPITPRELAQLFLAQYHPEGPGRPGSSRARWSEHYVFRLAYENAMLANEGGSAAAVEMEIGGWLGKWQIHKINRSPATKRIVSVGLYCAHQWKRNPDGSPLMSVNPINIERLGADIYLAPTDEERAAFQAKKAAAPKGPPLVNPTDEDAERLQAFYNRRQLAQFKAKKNPTGKMPTDQTVKRMTQAEYTHKCREMYRIVEAHGIKLRRYSHFLNYTDGPSVIILTDKPQKPLPIDWQALEPQPEAITAPAPVLATTAKPEPREPVPAGLLF